MSEHFWTARWERLGGVAQSQPAACSRGSGALDIFWQGADSHLKHKWFPSTEGGWSWEQDLGGQLASAPTAVSWGANRIDVFWRGIDNHLKHKWYPLNGDWSWELQRGIWL